MSSNKRLGVVRFLGTNCDQDIWEAAEAVGLQPEWLWFEDRFEGSFAAIVVPGGFSYGDYLRAGALAARSPVMASVKEQAEKGTPVLGICNGFQILCESQLLPGALVKNHSRKFIERWVGLKTINENKFFKSQSQFQLPVAHGEGCYYIPESELKTLQDQQQIWLQYDENINGSIQGIAGVTNKAGNVAGLMPHPERAMHDWMGKSDGRSFFESLIQRGM